MFKAENKFDHRLFAIKQVRITPREDLKKVLQEVENLSKAGTHQNIVKYIDCFLVQEEGVEDSDVHASSTEMYDYTGYTYNDDLSAESSSFISFDGNASSLIQVKERSKTFESEKKLQEANSSETSSMSSQSATYCPSITCICIKMEFCDFTLDQLMETLRTQRVAHASLEDLFSNASSCFDFQEGKLSSKVGPFSSLLLKLENFTRIRQKILR